MVTDDMALVREYARSNSEQAFATLVSQHVNLVYSVALCQVHDPHLAEEIAQAVFIILSREAKSLSPKTILSGWLCRTARYISADTLKSQRRRQFREQEAHMQSILNEPEPGVWNQIAPLLYEALNCLGEKEHDAVVLRFFDGKELKQVGAAMGTTEDAARMRVNRGVEQLRKFFTKRGVTLSATAITGAVAANSVQAAPAGLAAAITTAALSGTTITTTQLLPPPRPLP
jgi:RNA polymerase sigma factor (sigma-70 family)